METKDKLIENLKEYIKWLIKYIVFKTETRPLRMSGFESEIVALEKKVEEQESKPVMIYAAMYNPMTEESCYGIISLHKTRKGAKVAMDFHKAVELKEWEEIYMPGGVEDENDPAPYKFGRFEKWNVVKYKLTK